MKNKIKLLKFILFTSLLYSCEEKPLEAVYVEPPQYYLLDTIARSTRDPFVDIKDRGLEGFLVIFGYDKDNQVNGKVAKSDIDKIQRLSLDTFYYTWSHDLNGKRHEYFTEKYNLEVLDDKNLLDGQRKRLVIKSIDDLKHFDNLNVLEISSLVIDSLIINFKSELSHLTAPKKAIFLNLDSCKVLTNLEIGDAEREININLKNLKNLRYLEIHGGVDKLDLSKNTMLNTLILRDNPYQKLDLRSAVSNPGINVSRANKLTELYLPNNIIGIGIFETGIRNLDLSQYKDLIDFRAYNNKYITSINLNSASKLKGCNSYNNSLLTDIFVNSNVKIDTLAVSYGIKIWQKDSWTNWVIK